MPVNIPYLYSNCTNWSGKPFRKVIDFLEDLEGEEKPDFEQLVDAEMMKEEKFNYPKDYELRESDKRLMIRWRALKKTELMTAYRKKLVMTHKEIFKKKLVFKRPHLINYELMFNVDRSYVIPIFIKPGRTHFFVRDAFDINYTTDILHRRRVSVQGSLLSENNSTDANQGYRYYYSRHIIPVREEPIPKISKKMKRTFKVSKFQKEYSVFRDWKEDTRQTFEKCLRHDLQYWKCQKFVKDPDDYDAIVSIFTRHFSDIKEIFMQVVAMGAEPPDIKQLSFIDYCMKHANLCDEKITPSILDIYFASTNFEETDQEGNDDRALIRFEFLEILVRIVRGKYIETKKLKTMAEGLEKLLSEHVLPTKDAVYTWTHFRENILWEYHVNELFEANRNLLENLYQSLKSKKTKTRAKGG